MRPIVDPKIEKYLATVRGERDDCLLEMEKIAEKRDFPIVGPDVGALLYILTRISGAKRVLELGSGYGYSAYWFGLALPVGGQVVCTDTSEENRHLADSFFTRAGMNEKMRFELGEALSLMDRINGEFDIIFNDVDKEDYPKTIAKVLPKLKRNGLFITDNSLWYGRVVEDEQDEATKGVVEFNRLIAENRELLSINLPLRDGLMVCLKK